MPKFTSKNKIKQGASYVTLVALPFTSKSILRQKKKLLQELKYFHHANTIIFKKNPLLKKKHPKSFKIL
jgi:hypothetical protein